MLNQKKSKIIVSVIIIFFFGYGINQFFQSNKQKDQIIKHDMMIGACAKSKAGINSNKYKNSKTHEDIKIALQNDKIFKDLFKKCEKEFKEAPIEFRAKWKKN